MHKEDQLEKLECWSDLSKSCGWWEPFEGIVFVCERPSTQAVDSRGRLHCDDGPALLCRDGWPVYAVHGVRLPEYIIERPKEITSEKIEKEGNAEIRRVMIERFGKVRYLKESGAKLVHSDDYGKLWRKELTGDEPIVMVEVVNSTPEPDGSFKDYFLRVDPQLRPLPPGEWPEEKKREWLNKQEPQKLTARNAIASSSGFRGEEYVLEQQT